MNIDKTISKDLILKDLMRRRNLHCTAQRALIPLRFSLFRFQNKNWKSPK